MISDYIHVTCRGWDCGIMYLLHAPLPGWQPAGLSLLLRLGSFRQHPGWSSKPGTSSPSAVGCRIIYGIYIQSRGKSALTSMYLRCTVHVIGHMSFCTNLLLTS